jgi:hypothetical protein
LRLNPPRHLRYPFLRLHHLHLRHLHLHLRHLLLLHLRRHQPLHPQSVLHVRSLTTTLVVRDLRRHLTLPRPSLDLLRSLPLAMLFMTAAHFVVQIALASLLPFWLSPRPIGRLLLTQSSSMLWLRRLLPWSVLAPGILFLCHLMSLLSLASGCTR